jgi:hypothetical protein
MLTVAGADGLATHVDRMWAAPINPAALASDGERLIVLGEYKAVLVGAGGDVERRFPAASGFHYVEVETVPAAAGRPAALVLVARALDGRMVTRFDVWAI